MDHAAALRQTVHVAADGTVTRGAAVAWTHTRRILAATERHAKAKAYRGRSNDNIPADIMVGDRKTDILGTTAPHDCENHLRADESPGDRQARLFAADYIALPVAA
jgi:hypothetical protein